MSKNTVDGTGTKTNARISQFRLYRDANKAIPVNRMTKTAFVQLAVRLAADNPERLGLALSSRFTRPTNTEVDRISISWQGKFAEDVTSLADLFRLSQEEVVRLAVEASVFCEELAS